MDKQTIEQMLLMAYSNSDTYPKALANFLFREIIEDAHSKYHISNEDMKAMCKKAVDRAALYIALNNDSDPICLRAFAIHAAPCIDWDDSEVTEDIQDQMDLIGECIHVLNQTDRKPVPEDTEIAATPKIRLGDLQMTVRAYNALYRNGIRSVDDLLKYSHKELRQMKLLGKIGLQSIVDGLAYYGLSLRKE